MEPFEQNIIAVIWDFDKTLINGYMQEPIFKKYDVSAATFWDEVNQLKKLYNEKKVKVNNDTIYLNHILTCVEQGIFEGLDNQKLRTLGAELEFYNGVPDIFVRTREMVNDKPEFQKYRILVEHYIVSTGMAEMIRGSVVAPHVEDIWGCEFIENPIKSNIAIKEYSPAKNVNDEKNRMSNILR